MEVDGLVVGGVGNSGSSLVVNGNVYGEGSECSKSGASNLCAARGDGLAAKAAVNFVPSIKELMMFGDKALLQNDGRVGGAVDMSGAVGPKCEKLTVRTQD